MRMTSNKLNPIEWEWKTSNHSLFNYLKLRDYKKDEVYIWSFYQALYLLNLQSENLTSKYFKTEKIEDIYENKNKFVKVFKFLGCEEPLIKQKSNNISSFFLRSTLSRGD